MTFGITQAVHDQAAAARQEVAKQKESAALTATHEREAIAALAQATTSFADSQSELATGTARVAAGLADPGQPVMLANGEALKRNTFEVMRDFRHAQASLERALAQVQALPASPEQASQRAQAIEEARRALESGRILHARILAAPAPSSPGVLEGGGADLEDLAAQNPRASSDDAEPSAREQHLIGCQVPKPGQVCFEPNDGRIQLVGECKLGLSKVFPALKNALAAVMTRDRLDQTALGTFVLDLIGDIPLVGPLMKAGVAYGAETSVAEEHGVLTSVRTRVESWQAQAALRVPNFDDHQLLQLSLRLERLTKEAYWQQELTAWIASYRHNVSSVQAVAPSDTGFEVKVAWVTTDRGFRRLARVKQHKATASSFLGTSQQPHAGRPRFDGWVDGDFEQAALAKHAKVHGDVPTVDASSLEDVPLLALITPEVPHAAN